MAEMRASPVVNPRLLSIAKVLQDLQGPMGQIIPGTDVNPFKLLPAAQSVENWAYGNSPFSDYPSVTNRRLPVVKTGREREVGDLADTALMAAGIPAASRGVTKGANFLGDVLTQIVTRNPEATAVKVLEEAGNLVPLNRIFIPAKDEQALAMAKYMEERGVRPEKIWQKTGIGRLPAGRDYVQEIPDNEAVLSFAELPAAKNRIEIANEFLERKGFIPEEKKGIWGVGTKSDLVPSDAQQRALDYADLLIQSGAHYQPRALDRYMRHDQLKAVEPDLMFRTSIAREPEDALHRGMYRKDEDLVTTGGGRSILSKNAPEEEALSTAIHELQHAVQYQAGHGLGGSPEQAVKQLEMARKYDPAFSPAATQAHYDWKQAVKEYNMASRGEYLNQLKDYSQRPGLKPRMIFGKADWYAYGDDYRRLAGPMPKKPGPARDQWLNGAANHMLQKNLDKEPWNYGLMEEFDKRTAKNAQARASRVIKRNDKISREFEEAAAKYRNLGSLIRDEKGNIKESGKFPLYQRLEGEALARLAQTRLKLSEVERRANYPFTQQVERTLYESGKPVRKEILDPYSLDVPPGELFVYRENYNR